MKVSHQPFMRILFIDPIGWQYTVETPYERPIGGSQSALCYLAVELARLGHSVTILNGISTETETRGVKVNAISALNTPNFISKFDVGIILNAAIGRKLRRDLRVTIPLIL